MSYFSLGRHLPNFIKAPLFGDRKRFGLVAQESDPCWIEWRKRYLDFYYGTQKTSVGAVVNNAGYKVMKEVDLEGKRVLEMGPGDINHIRDWQGSPESFVIADINQDMLDRLALKLQKNDINFETRLLSRDDSNSLPFEDDEFDIIVSFYTLEHLYPLQPYLSEMYRVLKKGGLFMGGVPCEGGLAWGVGRYFTSRRWFQKHTSINPDKIICWEHPNFTEYIFKSMDQLLIKRKVSYWPLYIPSIDLNLVAKFIYEKR